MRVIIEPDYQKMSQQAHQGETIRIRSAYRFFT